MLSLRYKTISTGFYGILLLVFAGEGDASAKLGPDCGAG